MNNPFVNLLVRVVVLALGVMLSARIVPGIGYDTRGTLLSVVALLSLFNAVLKPLLLLFTLPFVVLSLGLGIWLINAFLFLLVGRLIEGFRVTDFGSALLGALIVSVTNFLVSRLLARASTPRPPRNRGSGGGDVIDV